MIEAVKATHSRRLLLRLAAMVPAFALAPPALRAQPREAGEQDASAFASTFEDVWQTVRDRFYDPHLSGLDWTAVRNRYMPEAARATTEQEVATVINRMLSELQASHTRYYTPDEPEYYQLAGIFTGALRGRGLERVFPGGRISYPGIGILSRMDASGSSFVTGVIDGTPAQKAGLITGDQIVTANGASFQPIRSFQGKVGDQVALAIRRADAVLQVPVTPVDIKPNRMFLDGLKPARAQRQSR